MTLPAGSYTFNATIPLSSGVSVADFFSCYVNAPGGTTVSSGYYTTPPYAGTNEARYASIPISGAATITAGTVSIDCILTTGSVSVDVSGANLTATATGDLTTS